jgi:hypothetical protein
VLIIIDWQTAALDANLGDVSYLLATEFVATDPGANGYSLDECWTDYRRYAYAGLIVTIVASTAVGRTGRGDQMFVAMADRAAPMAAELDTAILLST